jgi:hypothetical protein
MSNNERKQEQDDQGLSAEPRAPTSPRGEPVSNTKGAVLSEWHNNSEDETAERLWSYPNEQSSAAARIYVRTLDVFASVPFDVLMTSLGKAKDMQSAMDMADAWLENHARLGLPRIQDVVRLYGEWLAARVALSEACLVNDDEAALKARAAVCAAYEKWEPAERELLLVAGIGIERWKERKARQKPQ